jgi:hypothetical protein
MERSRLLLGPVLLAFGCGVAAQPSLDAAHQAVASDSRKYSQCLIEGDVDCIDAFVAWDLLTKVTGENQRAQRPTLGTTGDGYSSIRDTWLDVVNETRGSFRMMDAAPPGEPFAAGARLFSIVPYRSLRLESGGVFYEQTSYMLGVSEDAGLTWRFITGREPAKLEVLVPGISEMPVPSISDRTIVAPPRERSKHLRTTSASFSFVAGAALYDLVLEIRKEVKAEIEILVLFDDPADILKPGRSRTRLVPGQETLAIRSPLLTGFERGQIYEVAIYGNDPITAEDLFEHRQPVLFVPTLEQFELMTREAAP